MKIILRLLGAIVLLALIVVAFIYVWGEPIGRMPGRHLHGTVATQPVEDWTTLVPARILCAVEVDAPSTSKAANIACVTHGKNLYISHLIVPGHPQSWGELLAANLNAGTIRIGKNIYPVAATPLTDPAERQWLWTVRYPGLHPNNTPAAPPDNFLLFQLKSR